MKYRLGDIWADEKDIDDGNDEIGFANIDDVKDGRQKTARNIAA